MSKGPWKIKGDARFYAQSHIRIPEPSSSAHLLIRFLYNAIRNSKRTLYAICDLAGMSRMSLFEWFTEAKNPRLDKFEAALNATGFGFEIVAINPDKLTWKMFQALEKINEELREMRELLNDDLPYPSHADLAADASAREEAEEGEADNSPEAFSGEA